VGGGSLAYYQIINGCPPPGASPDLNLPSVANELQNINGLSTAQLPLTVDAGIPGAQ
jgi:hypothetical protein